MAATAHRDYALKIGAAPTHCTGKIRRIFVRPYGYYAPIGYICDQCSAAVLDEERFEEMAAQTARFKARKT